MYVEVKYNSYAHKQCLMQQPLKKTSIVTQRVVWVCEIVPSLCFGFLLQALQILRMEASRRVLTYTLLRKTNKKSDALARTGAASNVSTDAVT